MKRQLPVLLFTVLFVVLFTGCITPKLDLDTKTSTSIVNESNLQIIDEEQRSIELNGWVNSFGGAKDDSGVWITETEDNNYLVIGSSNSYNDHYDVYMLEIDKKGNKTWQKTIGDKYDENAFSAVKTREGGYVITGTTNSYDFEWRSSDVYLLKIDNKGNEIWHRNFAYDKGTQEIGNAVIQTVDGGYLIVGTVNTYDTDKWTEILIIKTDSNGNQEWINTYGGEMYDAGYSVIETEDGYIIAGMIGTKDRQYDIYIMKIDTVGNLNWGKHYGTSQFDEAYSVELAYDGGYLIAGRMNNFEPFVMKIDKNGEEVWTRKYTFGNLWAFNHITRTSDGNYSLIGNVNSVNDIYLLKINTTGDVIWSKTYIPEGTESDFSGKWISETSDGGLVAVGTIQSNNVPNVYVIRVPGKNT